jgi:hypothetical protein
MTDVIVAQTTTTVKPDAEAEGAALADAHSVDWAAAWGDWMELTYDPDAQPVG